MKKRINGCRKGKAEERAACHFLAELGFPACRNARNGVKSAGDILCERLAHVHLEVKARKGMDLGTAQLDAACEQAKRDCQHNDELGEGTHYHLPWVVLWKRGRCGWMLTCLDARGNRITYDTKEGIKAKLEEMAQ